SRESRRGIPRYSGLWDPSIESQRPAPLLEGDRYSAPHASADRYGSGVPHRVLPRRIFCEMHIDISGECVQSSVTSMRCSRHLHQLLTRVVSNPFATVNSSSTTLGRIS